MKQIMITKKIYILIALFASISFQACEEAFLDTQPANSVAADQVFANTSSANAAVNGIYRAMTRRYQNSQGHSGYPAHMIIIDVMADDMVLSTVSNGWHRGEQQWVSHRNENGTMPAFGFDLFY